MGGGSGTETGRQVWFLDPRTGQVGVDRGRVKTGRDLMGSHYTLLPQEQLIRPVGWMDAIGGHQQVEIRVNSTEGWRGVIGVVGSEESGRKHTVKGTEQIFPILALMLACWL